VDTTVSEPPQHMTKLYRFTSEVADGIQPPSHAFWLKIAKISL
jgi:hypothetical protein